MNPLSITATGVAIANYQKAKSEVEKAKQDVAIENAALTIAINQYNETKYSGLEGYASKALNPETGLPYDENDPISGVQFIPMLEIHVVNASVLGITVLSILKQYPVVNAENTTDREITIKSIAGQINCCGYLAAKLGDSFNEKLNIKLAPYSTTELNLSSKLTGEAKKIVQEDEDAIIKFNSAFTGKDYEEKVLNELARIGGVYHKKDNGKKIYDYIKPGTIIQSTPKIKDGLDKGWCVMNLEMVYSDSKNKDVRRALYRNIQGSIVYVG